MKISKPRVLLLGKGEKFTAKRMAADAGELLPKHKASVESVLTVTHGECILYIQEKEHTLKPGDAYIIPAKVKHQIKAIENLKAVHIMPNNIKFDFFK